VMHKMVMHASTSPIMPVRKGRQAAGVMVSAHFQNVSPIVEVRSGIGKFNPLDYLGLDYLQRMFGKLLGAL